MSRGSTATSSGTHKALAPILAASKGVAYHSLAYSFDFKANIVSGEPAASFAINHGGPWGKWTCEHAAKKTSLALALRPANDVGTGRKVRYRLKLSCMTSEYNGMRYIHQTDYREGWDAAEEEGKLSICVKVKHREAAAEASDGRYEPRLEVLEVSGNPPDVRRFFPDAVEGGAELWTYSDFLSFCSPYMKTLLSSDFAEAVSVPAKRRKSEGKASTASSGSALPSTTEDPHDSDAEADDVYFAQKPHKLKQARHRSLPDELSSKRWQQQILTDLFASHRILREGGLTAASTPAELFDKTCILHEPWRRIVIEYIAQNWDKVKKTAEWQELEQQLEADEIPGSTPIMLPLMKAKGTWDAQCKSRGAGYFRGNQSGPAL
ncbi:hypothetical protein JCM10296v2_004649 [Rhodotorula toruloides]